MITVWSVGIIAIAVFGPLSGAAGVLLVFWMAFTIGDACLNEYKEALRGLRVLRREGFPTTALRPIERDEVEPFWLAFSADGVMTILRDGIRCEVLRNLKNGFVSLLVGATTMLAVTVVFSVLLVVRFRCPLSANWLAAWLSSGFLILISTVALSLVVSACIDAYRLRFLPDRARVSEHLMLRFAQAYANLPQANRSIGDPMKRKLRGILLGIANDLERLLPRALGCRDACTKSALAQTGNGFRALASETVLSKRETSRMLECAAVAGLVASATGLYGELCSTVGPGSDAASAASRWMRILRSVAWFCVPAGIVIAVNYLIPGSWPGAMADNWRTIATGWALFSLAKGFDLDVSDIRELARPLLPKG